MRQFFYICSIFICSSIVHAQYYDTIPKGVRLLLGKHIQSEVSSSYNQSKAESPYKYEIELNTKNLEKIDDQTVKEALELFKPYQEAYDQISLGNHRVEGSASVNVNAYAFAYGLTDRLTAYVGIPIYDAKVSMKYKKTKNDSLDKVADILQKKHGDDWAQTLGINVENFYKLDESLIQSGFVNGLGYNEIGDWRGTGLGDTELGIMYNFLREDNYGLMSTFGLIAPTGYVDDPDLIQDIGFGDGQWDAFFEFGGGYVINSQIILNAWSRYTYQFESSKTLRTPYSYDTNISDKKDKYNEKLGNKLLIGLNSDLIFNDWFKLQPNLIFQQTAKAKYKSDNSEADKMLENNTESESQSFKLLSQVSSVNLYKQNKFFLPGQINLSYQHMLSGKNTPKVNILELEFRMFF